MISSILLFAFTKYYIFWHILGLHPPVENHSTEREKCIYCKSERGKNSLREKETNIEKDWLCFSFFQFLKLFFLSSAGKDQTRMFFACVCVCFCLLTVQAFYGDLCQSKYDYGSTS